jgi:hypothetical protein
MNQNSLPFSTDKSKDNSAIELIMISIRSIKEHHITWKSDTNYHIDKLVSIFYRK